MSFRYVLRKRLDYRLTYTFIQQSAGFFDRQYLWNETISSLNIL